MAFRLLPRARFSGSGAASSTSSSAASGAASAAAALALGAQPGIASCDAQQPVGLQSLRIVQLDSSWEDVLRTEPQEKGVTAKSSTAVAGASLGAALGSAARGRGIPDDADKQLSRNISVQSSSSASRRQEQPGPVGTGGAGGGGQVVTFSLGVPSQAERDRALDEIEAMLKDGPGSLASSGSSWGDASATIEASERALMRYKEVKENHGDVASSSFSLVEQPQAEESAWDGPRSVRMPQAPASLDGSASSIRALGSSHGGAGLDLSMSSVGTREHMLDVLSKHQEKVGGLLCNPAVWNAIMSDPGIQDLLREEQATATGFSEPTYDSKGTEEDDEGEQRGTFWSFFSLVQNKVDSVVAGLKKFFLGQTAKEAAAESANPGAKDDDSSGPWNVLGGILAVVVAVAFVVLLHRVKK